MEMASLGADVNGIDIDEKKILKGKFHQGFGTGFAFKLFSVQDVYSPEFSSQRL